VFVTDNGDRLRNNHIDGVNMFLHDVKIGTKLFLAFGFFIVLMVVSAVSLLSLNRANNGMQPSLP
jgi:methyl-accepting chemotaxis protein-2 (aspartate sensor receptor)